MRVTAMSKEKATSAGSTAPLIGAAARKWGVAASGRCPSPHNRPDVASSPIQPAPGTYTSPQLDQIPRHEARREADVTQDLHEQPRAVAARARLRRKRLLRRLHAGFHADQI